MDVSDQFLVLNIHRRIEISSIIRILNCFRINFQCMVVCILQHFDFNINYYCKWNPWPNYNKQNVHGGSKKIISVFWWKSSRPSILRLLYYYVFVPYHYKLYIFTSNIHYHWKGMDFVGVIVLRILHFLKNLKPIKKWFFLRNYSNDLKEGISFWSFYFTREFFTHMETSSLPVNGCNILP